ncbi:hypothetical protein [Ottowia sp.]|uniref:hypothetical protein n=1 Tax=Ottowia sp. TaxID=1898956 RepID=UPI0025D9D6DB|nr:hypothetical protein [Ottowia sp.]MBK6616510.1 hypothetical protein [Ottowia sp.]
MLYTVEHQKIESTIAGPYTVVVFKHRGPRPDNRTAFVASTVTGIQTPELCDQRALTYAENFGATIVTPMLTEQFALLHMERMLPRESVIAGVRRCEEACSRESIGYYRSIDALAEKVRSSRNWTRGETFVWVSSPNEYLILTQIAPDSCEMLVVLPSGADDVLTAYRFSQEDLVQKLLCYLEVMGEAAANI